MQWTLATTPGASPRNASSAGGLPYAATPRAAGSDAHRRSDDALGRRRPAEEAAGALRGGDAFQRAMEAVLRHHLLD